MKGSVFLTLAATALSTPLSAQDYNKEPSYGEITLKAGFEADPYSIGIVAGGDIDASSTLGGECAGWVADAPDFRLHYSAGELPLLIAAVGSDAGMDVTLVISSPNGQWACDDDSFEDGDAAFLFSEPQPGQYDIWIGNFESQDGEEATLYISESMALQLLDD